MRHQVAMSETEYREYLAWKNRPRCPNEGQMCNCTGACQDSMRSALPSGAGSLVDGPGLSWSSSE